MSQRALMPLLSLCEVMQMTWALIRQSEQSFEDLKPSKQTVAAGFRFTTQMINLVLLITDGKEWREFLMKEICEKWERYNTAKRILCGWINWFWPVWFCQTVLRKLSTQFMMWGNKEPQYSAFYSLMTQSQAETVSQVSQTHTSRYYFAVYH